MTTDRRLPVLVERALRETARALTDEVASSISDPMVYVPSKIRHLAWELANVLDYADGLRGES